MFDLPFPIPQGTVYERLGLGPDATSHEIREALSEYKNALERRLADCVGRLEGIRADLPEYRRARQRCDTLASHAGPADPAALHAAEKELKRIERQVVRDFPELEPLSEEVLRLGHEISALNELAMDQTASREAYDASHPPYEILKLADCARSGFPDRRRTLWLVREEVSRYIESQGMLCAHASDLNRHDFRADFTFTPLLDGEETPWTNPTL